MSGIIRKEDMHESFWQEGVSNPNLLINGDFQVWQRGTKFININQIYTADRWFVYSNANVDVLKERNSARINKHTAGSIVNFWQIIEKANAIRNRIITLSFKARSNINANLFCAICVGTSYDGATNRIQKTVSITTQENKKYSITFDTNTLNLPIDSDVCIDFRCSNVDTIWFADIKLEVGALATPFYPRSYGEELILCRRYFKRIPFGYNWAMVKSNIIDININSDVPMRTGAPSVKFVSEVYAHSDGETAPIKITEANVKTTQMGGELYVQGLGSLNGKMIVINSQSAAGNFSGPIATIDLDAEIY